MPLYEYRCRDCEHRFEVLQQMGEGAEGLRCPKCHGGELDKQFSTFSGGTGPSAAVGGGGCAAGGGAGFS